MSELSWLDYTGQTVPQIIALHGRYRVDSLVTAVEQAIEQKVSSPVSGGLSTVERTVLEVASLEREVNNGGFHQFFHNAPEHALVISDSLLRIGCPKAAAIARAAVAKPGPVAEAHMVQVLLDDIDPGLFQDEDQRFLEYPEDIAGMLFAYIRASWR